MAGISSKAAGGLINKKKYNTWERNEDLDLFVDESFYRVNDYQIGRFWQPDPKIEMGMEGWSPYTSNLNNPVRYNDLQGDIPGWFIEATQFVAKHGAGLAKLAVQDVKDAGAAVSNIAQNVWSSIKADPGGFLMNGVGGIGAIEKSAVALALKADVTVAKSVATETKVLSTVAKIPDEAKVVRGGVATPEKIAAGTGTHPSGVTGFSVECGNCSVAELAAPLPHNQVGVTTAGAVREAGGDVLRTSGATPNHATVTGLPPAQATKLLTPPIKNPAKPILL
jgi:RHS repeat-associated protein